MDKETEHVLKVDNRKKYEYFIKKTADYEEVWALRDKDGWATLGLDEKVYFPVWAKKEYADLCVSEEWEGYHSEPVDIYEFVEEWIVRLKQEGIRITVMWNNGSGIDTDWDNLLHDIQTELENY